MIDVLIVHYNTPELTEACIKSINKHTPDCKIHIFDNSDKRPFTAHFDNVEIIDNTKGQIIDFDKWLEQYPERFYNGKEGPQINGWASAKHCYTIQKALEIINKPIIHIDSDTLIKKDFSELYDLNFLWVGKVNRLKNRFKQILNLRVVPYICFINVPMMLENNICYFDDKRMLGLTKAGDMFDTGASFYEDTKNFINKIINDSEYIEHFRAGSWYKMANRNKSPELWLKQHENLWK